jgi:uncharacterized protein with GYD domain
MAMYASHVTVEDREFQNVQELASIWGGIRDEIEAHDVDVLDTYAVLGDYDFLVLLEAPDRKAVFQAAITVQSHGLHLETSEITPTENFANLVEDR